MTRGSSRRRCGGVIIIITGGTGDGIVTMAGITAVTGDGIAGIGTAIVTGKTLRIDPKQARKWFDPRAGLFFVRATAISC